MITIASTAIVDQIENFPIVVAMGTPLSPQNSARVEPVWTLSIAVTMTTNERTATTIWRFDQPIIIVLEQSPPLQFTLGVGGREVFIALDFQRVH